jgi:hypothetical protein
MDIRITAIEAQRDGRWVGIAEAGTLNADNKHLISDAEMPGAPKIADNYVYSITVSIAEGSSWISCESESQSIRFKLNDEAFGSCPCMVTVVNGEATIHGEVLNMRLTKLRRANSGEFAL